MTVRCDACHINMFKISRRNELAELSDDPSEGEIADFIGAQESQDYGAWNMGIVEYKCLRCKAITELISDDLVNYNTLIINWHDKATSGDYFSKFIFEYLAFISHVKNNLYLGLTNDRSAIQSLKRDDRIKNMYSDYISRHKFIETDWACIIKELKERPIHNSSRDLDNPSIDGWWNSNNDRLDLHCTLPKGRIHNIEDWGNMVEFWYSIRNNLFHGGKDPTIKRDQFLVSFAYKTLRALMDLEVNKLKASR